MCGAQPYREVVLGLLIAQTSGPGPVSPVTSTLKHLHCLSSCFLAATPPLVASSKKAAIIYESALVIASITCTLEDRGRGFLEKTEV